MRKTFLIGLPITVYLGWKLKRVFVSTIVRPSDRSLIFHIFIIFSRITGPILKQKAFLGKDSSSFKWKSIPVYNEIAIIHWRIFKPLGKFQLNLEQTCLKKFLFHVCLFTWGLTSNLIFFHSFEDVTITVEGLYSALIIIKQWGFFNYCDTGQPFRIVISVAALLAVKLSLPNLTT